MIFLNEFKPEFDKRLTKSYRVPDQIDRTAKPLFEKNISYGGEFIDDAIRIVDQPFRISELVKINLH